MTYSANPVHQISLESYVSVHCPICAYAYDVADLIRRDFPMIDVRLVDIHAPNLVVPVAVFAIPTYLLDGRLWSLGNPSPEKIQETFHRLCERASGNRSAAMNDA
ncbi:MAG: hypothetical protein KF832_05245 [Caldilineaceae bacterium]|nr:hypothetical protein [Caldilineaceae bacterium]